MNIKVFRCGLCKEENREGMTRKNLRRHLREVHKIVSLITNSSYTKKLGYIKQRWWIEG